MDLADDHGGVLALATAGCVKTALATAGDDEIHACDLERGHHVVATGAREPPVALWAGTVRGARAVEVLPQLRAWAAVRPDDRRGVRRHTEVHEAGQVVERASPNVALILHPRQVDAQAA